MLALEVLSKGFFFFGSSVEVAGGRFAFFFFA